MRILFVQRSIPGQYLHLADSMIARGGHEIVAIGDRANSRPQNVPGIKLIGYEFPLIASELGIITAIRRGRVVAAVAKALKRDGFSPDVIWAHSGWGESIFLKDVFPQAKLIIYCEYFYRAHGADAGFDPEYPAEPDHDLRTREINASLLMALDAADRGVTPTLWQHSLFPMAYASRLSVIHDGIDTDRVRPSAQARFKVPGSDIVLSPDDEVVTFVARNLEPVRGFHSFMRAIPEIQRRRPRASIVVVGGDEVLYGAPMLPGSHRQRMLSELAGRIDHSRVFMPGRISYTDYLALLQVSSVHVYLTYPFILSWSMLEAMAAGCVVIGSRTAPVEEVIRHGENGFLVDFF